MYGDECVTRNEAEEMMKKAIVDYLSISQLQDILEVIFDEAYMVIEDGDIPEEEEDA